MIVAVTTTIFFKGNRMASEEREFLYIVSQFFNIIKQIEKPKPCSVQLYLGSDEDTRNAERELGYNACFSQHFSFVSLPRSCFVTVQIAA